MNKILKFVLMLSLFAFLLVPNRSVQARGLLDGKVIFGDDFTLESGQRLDGDLVVFGGDVTIETGAVVEGSVIVFGGTISQHGQVDRDIVIFGGQIELGEVALVKGDIITIGGQIDRAVGAVIGGDVIENIPAPTIEIPNSSNPPDRPEVDINVNPVGGVGRVIINALVVGGMAMLLMLFLQPQIERVGQAIVAQPLVSGGLGLLTAILAPLVLLIMVITILLIPVAAITVLLLMLAWLFGIIAIGQEVGERFTQAIHQTWAPVLSIGFGTFLLMLVGGLIGLVPCVGWLAPLVLGFMGLGGAVMTVFGTRPVDGSALARLEPVPPAG